ncbi:MULTISPECIES: restriction endonuclease subunit S [Acinetobacter]|uniref:Restriction endonuclease subunit S n=1 Tax=Acinetobacter pseudolwoffii TaxID=2053287 RepID=A0A2H9YUK5_9GAMM|nr:MULTISPECIES: restriction endonuclease subunit S [Acinetobacter]PJO76330.1 restriction endonuclease subunit S [Acinetobacter pseudolwoffii]
MMTQSNLTFTENHEIPEGYKKTEVGIIPNDWTVESLQNLCRSSITYGIVQCGPHIPNGIPYIRVSDMNSSELNVDEMLRTSPEIASSFGRSKVEEGDIVYALRGKLGEVKMVGTVVSGANLTQGTARIAPKNNIDNRYLLWTLRSPQALKQAVKEAKGSTFVEITLGNLKGISVPLPSSREEQQKIATALSDTDALISELEKLIEKKQAIKTATMQQLLTGKTRLPEFALREDGTPKGYKDSELGQIPEDWEIYPLRSLLKSQPKYGINAAATALLGNLPTYIRITDINEDGKFSPTEKVGVNSPLSENYILERGDIVLARTGASVGKSYLYDEDDGELIYAGFLIKISPASNLLCSKYLSLYFQTKEYWDWIATNSMRSGQPGINGNQYANLKIALPAINEQLKISRIFIDIDKELEKLKIKLNKVSLLKQGMMQELLTGKTRLV